MRLNKKRIKAESISTIRRQLPRAESNPGKSVVQQLKQTKAQLEAEYQENLKIFKPAYPKMLQLQVQINQIQAKIDEEVSNVKASIKAAYEAAKSQQELLAIRLEEVKGEVSELQNRSIEYNILKREVDTNRQLYENILQRLKEVGVASAVRIIISLLSIGRKNLPALINLIIKRIFP
ncbi:MAG: hypothetical protein R3F37_04370 [Candidatus Competibacteraceae bacterium]